MEGRKQNTFTKEERTSDILRIKKSSLLPSSLCPNWGTWGRLEMKLPRPNYTKLDPFFCKKGGVYIFQSKAFFLGHVGHFFGPWEGLFVTPGPVSNFEGGFPRMRGDL